MFFQTIYAVQVIVHEVFYRTEKLSAIQEAGNIQSKLLPVETFPFVLGTEKKVEEV